MTTLSLYQIAHEYKQAADTLANLELDEQTIADTLSSLDGDLTVKATNVAFAVRNIEALADSIQAAEKQMAERRKAMENRAARVRDYLLQCMEHAGVQKIECPQFALSIKNNPAKVVIFDDKQLPAEYLRIPPPEPDKKAIKAAIDAGKEIAGAKLEQGKRLEIR